MEKKSPVLITFLVDHASPAAFFNLIDNNAAPYVSKYILGEKTPKGTYSKAAICRNVVTGFPSTSANTHVSLLTGDYASKNDMLYAYFWDLTKMKPRYLDTEAISISLLNKLNYEYISKESKLFFEYFKTSASFHAINRGADYRLFTPKALMTKFLPLLIKMKKKNDPNGVNPIAKPELWREYFLNNIGEFLGKIEKEGHLPQGNFIVFLLSDENAHKYGFDSQQYKEAVQILDFFVQSIVEGLTDNKGTYFKGLKDLGYEDSVMWCICTDHAGREVFRDKLILLNEIIDIELGLTLLEGSTEKDQGILAQIKHDYTQLNAFTNVGVEFWQAWFGGQQRNTLDEFRRFYPESHYRALIPTVPKKYDEKNMPIPVDLISYLLEKDYVQFVIIPEDEDLANGMRLEPPPTRIQKLIARDYKIRILSAQGTGLVIRSEINKESHYTYKIINGKDPLSYEKSGLAYDKAFSHHLWLESTLKLENPDVFHRLFGYFDCKYAPNFLVTSKWEYRFQSVPELAHRKRKALLNIQTHDGLYAGESIVPLTIAGAGVKKGVEIPFARNIDVLPTLLSLMDIQFDQTKVDGKPLPNLREE